VLSFVNPHDDIEVKPVQLGCPTSRQIFGFPGTWQLAASEGDFDLLSEADTNLCRRIGRCPSEGLSTEPNGPTAITRGFDTNAAATVAAGLAARVVHGSCERPPRSSEFACGEAAHKHSAGQFETDRWS